MGRDLSKPDEAGAIPRTQRSQKNIRHKLHDRSGKPWNSNMFESHGRLSKAPIARMSYVRLCQIHAGTPGVLVLRSSVDRACGRCRLWTLWDAQLIRLTPLHDHQSNTLWASAVSSPRAPPARPRRHCALPARNFLGAQHSPAQTSARLMGFSEGWSVQEHDEVQGLRK